MSDYPEMVRLPGDIFINPMRVIMVAPCHYGAAVLVSGLDEPLVFFNIDPKNSAIKLATIIATGSES